MKLLGASADAQAAAEVALRRLATAQRSTAASVREWLRAGSAAGVFFSLEQLLHRVHLSCVHSAGYGDWLHACWMAAQDSKRVQAFHSIALMLDL